MGRRHQAGIGLIIAFLLGFFSMGRASAQVVVDGGNVRVDTGDGNTVRVENGKVSVKTGPGGKSAVAVGSGQRVVNVGSGNVAVNERGTIDGKPVAQARKSGKSRAQQKQDDDAFWGEGGFWGEDGEPGSAQAAGRKDGKSSGKPR